MPGLENWGVEYCQDWKMGGLATARIGGLKSTARMGGWGG